MRMKPKIGDLVLVLFLVACMVLVPVLTTRAITGDTTAVITQKGLEIARIRLTGLENSVIVTYGGNYSGEIEAKDGRIHFKEAHCPDQICVKTGWLSKPGQTAACLPAKVLIRIEGSDVSEEDIRMR